MVIQVGDTITTAKSGVTGTVVQIVPDPKGRRMLRIQLDSGKWTTVQY